MSNTQTLTVYTFTADNDNGMKTSVHLKESDAYLAFINAAATDEDDAQIAHKLFDEACGSDDFSCLDDYLQDLRSPLDSYSVESHDLSIPIPIAA